MMTNLPYEKYRKCDKCGNSPLGERYGEWMVYNNHCGCGGYIKTDYKTLYEDNEKNRTRRSDY